ncbi:site-2 protease family protein [Chloroflexi bacterium TSY]|nr:site-2 protease family protein [Chloroflexi bacterium TSY]
MKQRTIPLGNVLGIPIGLDYSWFLIVGLITWSMAASYYPGEFSDWSAPLYWIVGAATAIMLFVSVLLHELGHSMVALRYKIPVNRITLFIFGGVAEIGKEPSHATAEFWIALAGPAVSLALAAIFRVLEPVVADVTPLFALVKYLAYINGMLALFNLVPGFPLDGGRVLRAAIWGMTDNLHRATVFAANTGRFIAYFFIISGVFQMFSGSFANGLWIAFIGWFLENAAVAEVQRQTMQEQLAGHTAAQVMNRDYHVVPAETNLQRLVEFYILTSGRRCFVVEHSGEAIGLLTLHQIKDVSAAKRRETTAAQAMLPLDQAKTVQPDTELWDALQEMERGGVNQLPVMMNGRLLGLLSRGDVVSFLRTLRTFNQLSASES